MHYLASQVSWRKCDSSLDLWTQAGGGWGRPAVVPRCLRGGITKLNASLRRPFLATRNFSLPLKSCKWKPEVTDVTFLVYSTWVLVLFQNQYPRKCPYRSWGLLLNLPGPPAWEKWIGFVTTFSSKTLSQYFVAGKAEANSNLPSRMMGLLYLGGVASTEF